MKKFKLSLLVVFVFVFTPGVTLATPPPPVSTPHPAAGGCPLDPASPTDHVWLRAIPLSPAIPETESVPTDEARGVFLEREVTLNLENERVVLCSTPDGGGGICTDDVTIADVFPSNQRLALDFRDPTRSFIQTRPCVDITTLMVRGPNTIRLRLRNVTEPKAGSSPYYIILMPMSPPPPAELGIENLVPWDYTLPLPPSPVPVPTEIPPAPTTVVPSQPLRRRRWPRFRQ
jgi:hypothetical protein